MLNKIEDFFFNKLLGKIIARAALTGAAFVAGPKVSGLLGQVGVSVSVSPEALGAALTVGAHWAYEHYKAWRNK